MCALRRECVRSWVTWGEWGEARSTHRHRTGTAELTSALTGGSHRCALLGRSVHALLLVQRMGLHPPEVGVFVGALVARHFCALTGGVVGTCVFASVGCEVGSLVSLGS